MRSHGSSLWGFRNNILQGWFKMKTTSIFPVHGLASLILMRKYVHGRSMSSKLFYIYKINQFVSKRSTYYIKYCQKIPGEIRDRISSHEYCYRRNFCSLKYLIFVETSIL